MNEKRHTLKSSSTVQPKKRMTIYGNLSSQIKRQFLIRKYHVTLARTKTVTYSSQIIVQLLFTKINSIPSATSILSRSLMAYNTTETLDKLACTDYVDFRRSQDILELISCIAKDSNYLDIKLEVFKREVKNAQIRLRQNLTMGETDFNQFIRQKKSTSCCSRQLSQRTKFVTSSSIYTVQRHGGATEACSQSD